MSLETFCRKPLVKVEPDTSITEACELMARNNIGCLVVEQNGKLCGILTDRDIALRVAGTGKDSQTTRVKEIMTPDHPAGNFNPRRPETTGSDNSGF